MFILVGCNNQSNYIDTSKFNIVTSFYPMYIATSNIVDGVEGITLDNMADVKVGCLHDYQLTTKDMNKLETADAFIINGGGLENFLDKATSAYTDLNIINASDGFLDVHDDHEHENAHFWVSISLYIEEVRNIANGLAKLDSKNADKYLKNAESYIGRLEVLEDEMHDTLDGLEYKNIVTFHEAFEFFAEDFGLNVVAVIEREPGTSPSAGELAKIIDEIKKTSAVAIFVEPQYEKTVANTIANETNVPVYNLDPIVSGNLENGEYERIMRENLSILKEALKGHE